MAIHRDTQWPCPNGFHIPTKDEWQALYDILVITFERPQNYSTLRTYLKMPTPTALSNTTGGPSTSKTTWYYWTSTTLPGDDARAYVVNFTSSTFVIADYAKSNGMSIRPFADAAVEPESSRTTLYDWSSIASGAWIFMGGWYISISWDWSTRITIADKNVWATSVYNGSTSAATSWSFFQRWNNHKFPYAGVVGSTTAEKVDVSKYWPWRYYSGQTFITTSSSGNLDWADPSNNNLWGGVTNWTRQDPVPFIYHGLIWTWHISA